MTGKHLLGCGFLFLLATAALGGEKTAAPEGAMKLVQTLKFEKPQGGKNAGLRNVRVHGGFVYVHPQSHNKLFWYRRDGDGKLVEAGNLEGCSDRGMVFVGERLYMIRRVKGKPPAIAWYKVDAESGRPAEAGVVDSKVGFGSSVSYDPLLASPDGKHLYLFAPNRKDGSHVAWFTIGEDGAPAFAGKVKGEGIGYAAKYLGDTSLRISPDGRHLYVVSATEHKLAILERAGDGSLKHLKAIDLSVVAAKPGPADKRGWNHQFSWPGLCVSPDGRFVYANLWSYGKNVGNCLGLFKRDAEGGDLEFVGKLKWPAALKGFSFAISPDGKSAYMGHLNGPVVHARRDPATGRMAEIAKFPATNGPERQGPCIYDATLDAAGGYVYFADVYGKLFVFKL
ncbi:MAG: lactonase family protein [Planctomycetota bacterium]|jgi:6-phosphogluconolactonase (cycloisomerase 2 family)